MSQAAFHRLAPDVGDQDRAVVAPLSRDRVAGALEELDYPYHLDRAGQLGLLWPETAFQVRLLGPDQTVLQVRGRWHRRLAIERLPEVLTLLDGWNREFVGPKCYVRVLDDGRLTVVTETSAPLAAGISTEQLVHLLRRAVGQGIRVVRDLETRYPDPATRAPEGAA